MSTKDFSKVQEFTIANYLGWKVVTGSGARMQPGDIYSDDWLGECKTHTSSGKKITFNKKVWDKICDEAVSSFRFPVLFVDDGSQKISRTWCMFSNLPASDHVSSTFIQDTKSGNIHFDCLDMSKKVLQIKALGESKPVVFCIKRMKSTIYICSLSDFFELIS